jgi:hypothetical protein
MQIAELDYLVGSATAQAAFVESYAGTPPVAGAAM